MHGESPGPSCSDSQVSDMGIQTDYILHPADIKKGSRSFERLPIHAFERVLPFRDFNLARFGGPNFWQRHS
jgi:hypothetical protein